MTMQNHDPNATPDPNEGQGGGEGGGEQTREDMLAEMNRMREESKAVKAELEKARATGADTAVLTEQMDSIRDTVVALSEAIAHGDFVPEEAKQSLSQVKQTQQQHEQQRRIIEYYQNRMADVVEEAGLSMDEWNSDEFAKVREAWNKRDFANAERAVIRLGVERAKGSQPDINARIEEALKEHGVRRSDTGESSAPAATGTPTTRAEAAQQYANGDITIEQYARYAHLPMGA